MGPSIRLPPKIFSLSVLFHPLPGRSQGRLLRPLLQGGTDGLRGLIQILTNPRFQQSQQDGGSALQADLGLPFLQLCSAPHTVVRHGFGGEALHRISQNMPQALMALMLPKSNIVRAIFCCVVQQVPYRSLKGQELILTPQKQFPLLTHRPIKQVIDIFKMIGYVTTNS